MPVIARTPFLCLALTAGALAMPAAGHAQAIAPQPDVVARAPYMPGTDQGETLGAPRQTAPGRPRRTGQLRIELEILPTCALRSGMSQDLTVKCPAWVPYASVVGSDADADFTATYAFAREPDSGGLELVHAARFTVDY
jgi:hypothetical protein